MLDQMSQESLPPATPDLPLATFLPSLPLLFPLPLTHTLSLFLTFFL